MKTRGILLLGALALASLTTIACGSTPPAGTGGSGGSGATGGTGTTGGSGGTGGTLSSGGTGGVIGTGGTGGSGGSGLWELPACESVTGTDAVTFTFDDGATLAATPGQLTGVGYTQGLAALDTANTLLAEHQGELLRSTDAGCTWSSIGQLEGGLFKLTAAKGGRAYAWVDNGAPFYRYDEEGTHALTTPAPNVVGIGVDPEDGLHLRIGDASGNLHDSTDGGETWTKLGNPAAQGSFIGYRFAFDPFDLDHVIFGQSTGGASFTTDGGATWTKSEGLGENGSNAFQLAVSTVYGHTVWAEALEIGPDIRHIYRSTDGGATFESVVDESAEVNLINGNLLFPDANDADVLYFVFGTGYADYGTDLYRYDHTTGAVTKTHNSYDEVSAIVASPASPNVLYLGLTVENIN